jgi:hypothetical protein
MDLRNMNITFAYKFPKKAKISTRNQSITAEVVKFIPTAEGQGS